MAKVYRFIGDIHGNVSYVQEQYAREGFDKMVQLGDFGFSTAYLSLNSFDPDRLKVLGGNHDEYPWLITYPHYLGDYGMLDDQIFFARGAYSIDRDLRVEGANWWAMEEMTYDQLEACAEDYRDLKPRIVISHDGPDDITSRWYPNRKVYSSTASMLSHLYYHHQPKVWLFGHHHKHSMTRIMNTVFVCVGVDRYVDLIIEDDGRIAIEGSFDEVLM
jgi:predicted phosphodiesterase